MKNFAFFTIENHLSGHCIRLDLTMNALSKRTYVHWVIDTTLIRQEPFSRTEQGDTAGDNVPTCIHDETCPSLWQTNSNRLLCKKT